ncbi:MAG: hypothetical protein K1V97_01790 [Lachnospiraceae bacterium]
MISKEKTIPNGACRIIKIGKDAIFELIYETIIDNAECFFDVDGCTKIVTGFDMDWDKGELICTAYSAESKDNQSCLQSFLDTEKLMSVLKNTTDTMFDENRYIELTEEEIMRIQNESKINIEE